jgi:cold-inducible RNA-binding protein
MGSVAVFYEYARVAGNVSFPPAVRASVEFVEASERKGSVYIFIRRNRRLMAKKLYVGGLPYSTTEDQLREAFAQAGSVSSAIVIMDKMTGRSKGFGFVEFANDDDAAKAIDMWNGKDFGGRSLTVNEARPLEERPRRDSNRGGGGDWGGGGNGGGGRRNSW